MGLRITNLRYSSFNRHILLAIGWAALAFATYQAAQVKLSQILYDPFKILGISTVILIATSSLKILTSHIIFTEPWREGDQTAL